jgi:hypothetical protein
MAIKKGTKIFSEKSWTRTALKGVQYAVLVSPD